MSDLSLSRHPLLCPSSCAHASSLSDKSRSLVSLIMRLRSSV
ncbi:hypothetical protein [Pseudomonas sp. NPDC090208]